MRRHILFFAIFLFAPVKILSGIGMTSSDTSALGLRIKNINFMRDNEYSNPITKGYTLIGFIIQPTLVYKPAERITISLGAQLQSYAGTYKIKSPILIFSTQFRVSDHTFLTMGSLDGCEKHRLDDQIWSTERTYTAQTESGIRLATDNEHVFNDTWVNWENFVYPGDTTREVFVFGESFNYHSPVMAGNIVFDLPVQATFKHFGGQISSYPEHVETFLDASAGLRAGYIFDNLKNGRLSVEFKQFRFQYITLHGTYPLKSGDASRISMLYDLPNLSFSTGYWSGRDFYSPEGNPIFSNASFRDDDLFIHLRRIWFATAGYTLHLAGYLELYCGGETYYDIKRGHLDSALKLHLRFDKLIDLHLFR